MVYAFLALAYLVTGFLVTWFWRVKIEKELVPVIILLFLVCFWPILIFIVFFDYLMDKRI